MRNIYAYYFPFLFTALVIKNLHIWATKINYNATTISDTLKGLEENQENVKGRFIFIRAAAPQISN